MHGEEAAAGDSEGEGAAAVYDTHESAIARKERQLPGPSVSGVGGSTVEEGEGRRKKVQVCYEQQPVKVR